MECEGCENLFPVLITFLLDMVYFLLPRGNRFWDIRLGLVYEGTIRFVSACAKSGLCLRFCGSWMWLEPLLKTCSHGLLSVTYPQGAMSHSKYITLEILQW